MPEDFTAFILLHFVVNVNTAKCGKDNKGEVIDMYRRIRDLREDADLTQKQLGQALHCSQQVYANYELGQRDIPTATLIQLARFHGTSADYILGLTDERRPYPPSRAKA